MDRRTGLLAIAGVAGLLVRPAFAEDATAKRIGYITNGRTGPAFEAFKEGLAAFGYEPGRNISIEARFADGDAQRLPALADELVRMNVDVIAASGAVAVRAAQRATTRIPIIFAAVPSPAALVEIGLAATAQRPGANITGFSSSDPEHPAKSFRLLKDLLPQLERVALISDQDIPHSPADPGWSPLERAYDNAGRAAGLQPFVVRIKGPLPDLDAAFAAITEEKAQAVLVLEVPVPLQHLQRISDIALERRLATMFPGGYANAGALVNFGTTIFDANRAMAEYVDKVFKGANPGELPIGVRSRTELVINLKTAQQLGIVVAPDIARRADRLL